MSPVIRTLIVDDEPFARMRIRALLKRDSDIEVIGECATGSEAIAAIRQRVPDLLFLDIQMPEMDGFSVLTRLKADRMPFVIFVTAHDQYAVRAFEVHALDYLLKPFRRKRFEESLARAKNQIRNHRSEDVAARTLALLEGLEAKSRYRERMVIKTVGKVFFLSTEDIDWIQTDDNYVRVHVGSQSYLVREAMNRIEAQLDPRRFARIHRCTMVNIDRIKELQPWFKAEYRVILKDGKELPLSRSYREKLQNILGKKV